MSQAPVPADARTRSDCPRAWVYARPGEVLLRRTLEWLDSHGYQPRPAFTSDPLTAQAVERLTAGKQVVGPVVLVGRKAYWLNLADSPELVPLED